MVDSLSVRKVESKADFNTFLRFPWWLYRDDPYWVPPLVSMQRHKLDKRRNPAWQYLEGEYYVAWRGTQPVGTIAAFINHRHNEFQNERIGFFGLFETVDDQAVADALLETAAEYVAGKGYTALRGPASFSTNDECGILIEGFGEVPPILTPYNPPYYRRLLENAPGFDKVMDLVTYHFTLPDFVSSAKLEQSFRVTRKNNARRQITVRRLDRKRLRQELDLLRQIYNTAWDNNWGFVPLSDEELDALVKDLGQFVESRLAFFAYVAGRPVAFLMAIPDMNQVLHAAYPRPGTPEPLSLLRVLWHWKIRSKLTRIRIALMGVQQGYRGIGVEAALFAELFAAFQELVPRTSWRTADAGWVLETNEPMRRLVEALNGRLHRRFRFYERPLGG